jgi:hypothetical protein
MARASHRIEKAQAQLSLEAAMAQEMRIDGALEHGQAESRNDKVFHLLPDKFGVCLLGFHDHVPQWGDEVPRVTET